MAIKVISTDVELMQLSEHLKSKSRNRVACVFTHKHHLSDVDFDWQEIDSETWQYCDNYLIASTDLTRLMAEHMPARGGVFGGAARTYPVGYGQDPDHYAPIRACPNSATKLMLSEKLESDIWYWANQAGSLKKAAQEAVLCTATVARVIAPSRVFVEIGQDQAILRQELTFPGIPVEWIFKKGQVLSGSWIRDERLFLLGGTSPNQREILEQFPVNSVTVGIVSYTDRTHARVKLHPAVEIELDKAEVTGNPFDVVSKYLVIGDVVPVRIYRHPQGELRLRMNDIDDDEQVLPSIALLPGSEPWLEESRDLFSDNLEIEEQEMELAEVETQAIDEVIEKLEAQILEQSARPPLPGDPTKPDKASAERLSILQQSHKIQVQNLTAAREQIDDLKRQNRDIKAELGDLRRKYREKIGNSAELKAAAKQARQEQRDNQKSSTFSRRNRFRTNEDWLREELRRVWVSRYKPDDRDRFGLVDSAYTLHADFFGSFKEELISESEARKAIQIMLNVVTGRQWTDSSTRGHAVPETLDKGSDEMGTMYRIYIQEHTPQALRLVLRKLKKGGVVLIKVAKHDDY